MKSKSTSEQVGLIGLVAALRERRSGSAKAGRSATAVHRMTRPLVMAGLLYAWELLRCTLFGVAVSVSLFLGVLAVPGVAGHSLAASGVMLVCTAWFPILYGLAAHQRGIGRLLARLASAHGELLFEQTLGRFIEAAESRQSGSVAALLGSPKKLVAAFGDYVKNAPAMPSLLRHAAQYYVGKLGHRLDNSVLVEAVRDEQLDVPALRRWTVEHMRNAFQPSWRAMGMVFGLQLITVVGMWLWMR